MPQNISAAAASSFDSVEPIYKCEDFLYLISMVMKKLNVMCPIDNSIQNKPAYKRKGRFLDGSLSIGKLHVGQMSNDAGSSLFFDERISDIPNKFIGSFAQNIKTEGRNYGEGPREGIYNFLHEVRGYKGRFNLGVKSSLITTLEIDSIYNKRQKR